MKASLAGISALLFTAGLFLLLSRIQVLAQPAAEITALLVQKEVNTNVAAPGDTVTYTVTIREPVPLSYDTLWMTDTLPEEMTFVPGSLQPVYGKGTAGFANGVITWTASEFGIGNFAIITFSAQISPEITYAEIVNTAQVTGTGDLIESSAETIAIIQMGNLDNENTHKTVTPQDQAEPGDVLTYTVTLGNDSDDPVPGVQVVDRLPPGLELIASSVTVEEGDYAVQDNVITWTLDVQGNWWNIDLSFRANVLPYDGWITNTAEVSVPGHQPFTRTAGSYVKQRHPHLEASKSVAPAYARPGEYLTYTVRITNTGDGDAETVWMTDTLRPEVSYVTDSLTATMGSFGEAGGVITWNATLGPAGTLLLPGGEGAAITYTVQISPALTENALLTNTAGITGAGTLVWVNASANVLYRFDVYLPIVYKRWPPIPYAPILYNIDNPNQESSYTVSWSHDHPEISVISYTLQEATNSNFSGAVNYSIPHSGTENEKAFTDKTDGTYYYRVRAHNEYGIGEWSNVKSVFVFTAYFDDFNDSNSGWPHEKGPIKDDQGETHGYWHREYHNGQYRILIEQPTCWTCGWFYQPDAMAPYRPPSDKYCIETQIKFEDGAYWSNMGVVIGANDANRKIYAMCMSRGGDPDKLGWFLMRKDDYYFPMRGCSGPTEKVVDVGREIDTSRYGWNLVHIGVDGDNVTVYIDGNFKGQWKMEGLSAMTQIGVIGGDYEILPVDIRYAYFKVTPNADCAP
ncbi:MAG: hypothetical protein SXV54_18615 [Chloroflexota bacterium]|nr:hypothetical protein [Chloroflexota bacterium]